MSYGKINIDDLEKIIMDISTNKLGKGAGIYKQIQNHEKEEPEQWEIDMREKLNREVEDGFYHIGTPGGIQMGTGKQGYINFQIALVKAANKYPNG